MSYGYIDAGNRSSKHALADEDSDELGRQEAYELQDLRTRHGSNDDFGSGHSIGFSEDDVDYNTSVRCESISTAQSFVLYTPDEESVVRRKFDFKLVLFVAFLYMLSFLDRSSKSPYTPSLVDFFLYVNLLKVSVLRYPMFREARTLHLYETKYNFVYQGTAYG